MTNTRACVTGSSPQVSSRRMGPCRLGVVGGGAGASGQDRDLRVHPPGEPMGASGCARCSAHRGRRRCPRPGPVRRIVQESLRLVRLVCEGMPWGRVADGGSGTATGCRGDGLDRRLARSRYVIWPRTESATDPSGAVTRTIHRRRQPARAGVRGDRQHRSGTSRHQQVIQPVVQRTRPVGKECVHVWKTLRQIGRVGLVTDTVPVGRRDPARARGLERPHPQVLGRALRIRAVDVVSLQRLRVSRSTCSQSACQDNIN